jgi:hypothetical protein
MSSASEATAAKKRIMFIKGEDFNFLAYHVLIVLDAFRCNSKERLFKDHRKLAFLPDLISSTSLTAILLRRKRLQSSLSARDAHLLATAYANGASRRHLVARVISALAQRGLLSIEKAEDGVAHDLWLNRDQVPKSFLDSDVYLVERENIEHLLQISNRIRTVSLETFLDRFFGDHGVHTWHS